jgi:hypothetical protein
MIMAFLQTTTLARVQQAVGLADVNLQITDSSVAKLSRKYFARGFLPPSCLHGDTHSTDGDHRHHPMRRPTLRLRPQFTMGIEYRLFHFHENRQFSSTQRLCRSQQAVHYDRLFCLMAGGELQKTIPYGVEGCLIFGLFEESWPKSLDHTAPKGGHQYLVFRLVVVEKRTSRDTRRGSDGLQGRSLITLYDKEL